MYCSYSPGPGKVFLALNLTMTNYGYSSVPFAESGFTAKVGNETIQFDDSNIQELNSTFPKFGCNCCNCPGILDGQTLRGTALFIVPANFVTFQPVYDWQDVVGVWKETQ